MISSGCDDFETETIPTEYSMFRSPKSRLPKKKSRYFCVAAIPRLASVTEADESVTEADEKFLTVEAGHDILFFVNIYIYYVIEPCLCCVFAWDESGEREKYERI
jgi:hypothetical protein